MGAGIGANSDRSRRTKLSIPDKPMTSRQKVIYERKDGLPSPFAWDYIRIFNTRLTGGSNGKRRSF